MKTTKSVKKTKKLAPDDSMQFSNLAKTAVFQKNPYSGMAGIGNGLVLSSVFRGFQSGISRF
jgi:hypothetical protein